MIIYDKPWLEDGDVLAILGDSLTHNVNGYMKKLTEILTAKGIRVINAGLGGDKTPTALMRLQNEVIDKKPTALSVFLGSNDAAVGRGQWGDEPRVTPSAYYTNLRWIIHRCKQNGIKKFSITPPLWRFEGDVFKIQGDRMNPFCQEARNASADERSRFVPADAVFKDEWARHPGHTGLLLTTDGVHLNEKGMELLVEAKLKAWNM